MRCITIFYQILLFMLAECGWPDRCENTELISETGDSFVSTGDSSKLCIGGTRLCTETDRKTKETRIGCDKSVDDLDDICRIFNCEVFRAHRSLKEAQVALQSATSTLENYEYYLRIICRKNFSTSGNPTCSIQETSRDGKSSSVALPNGMGSSPEYELPSVESQEKIITEALERVTIALKAIDKLSELPRPEKKESRHKGKLRSLPDLFATSILKQVVTTGQKVPQDSERDSESSTDDPDSPLQMVSKSFPSKEPKDDGK